MRVVLLLFCLAFSGCAAKVDAVGAPRPEVLRDAEGYAIASCFVNQPEPYLKDQGDAWASVILQRMKGDLDVFASMAEQVKRESAKSEMAVIRNETGQGTDKILPVLYCSEIIDRPAVRIEIKKAVEALNPGYKQ